MIKESEDLLKKNLKITVKKSLNRLDISMTTHYIPMLFLKKTGSNIMSKFLFNMR